MGRLLLLGWFIFFLLIISCRTREKQYAPLESKAALDSGELLAKTYCSSCHLFPEPVLLDKTTWVEHALPAMGYRFGIYKDRTRDSLIEKGMGGRMVENANIFPSQQIISNHEWELIQQFYFHRAPVRLIIDDGNSSTEKSIPFKTLVPDFKIERPAISAMTYDVENRQLFVADCSRDNYTTVNVLDTHFKPITSLGLPYPVSKLAVRRDTLYILMMGHFVPSDEPVGQLIKAVKNRNGIYEGYQLVLKGLTRPVDIAYADLDDDGDEDIVVAEFGNHTGSVSLFVKHHRNTYQKKLLLSQAGSVSMQIEDLDNDGKKDIIVLMAQGDEGIDIYFNKGANDFERKRILRFPPTYGSSSFSLIDINRDGYKDIVYVNGDNADASQILKPYHGVHIFINDQHNYFSESYFYQFPGAYKALTTDYDNDGDVDIAAISFFPDFLHHPEKGFVYLENISKNDSLNFLPLTTEVSKNGRWITMLDGDFNNDNHSDILLGSFTSMTISGDTLNTLRSQYQQSSPLLFLEYRN